jgi:serine/threonine-protein kinase
MDAEICPEHHVATLSIESGNATGGLEVGSVLAGRYLIQRVIGRGGYGSVYEARHTGTGQGVAIKTLASNLEAEELALRRFFQEARVTAGLKHPNTIRVFDFGQDESGLVYLAMELLSGMTLKQALKDRIKDDRVFSEKEAIEIGIAVTRSLGEAHAAGLVHRDLKPDNIFLHEVKGDDPIIKVLDFGIVKLANSSLTLGSDSGIPGTPAYMSPEQVTSKEIDGRSDLYSLAIVLYSLVTGTVPFRGQDVMQTLWQHVHEKPPDLKRQARTSISDAFAKVIHRGLEKDPQNRPQDAREMRRLLVSCLGDPSRVSALAGADISDDQKQRLPSSSTMPSRSADRATQPLAHLFKDAEELISASQLDVVREIEPTLENTGPSPLLVRAQSRSSLSRAETATYEERQEPALFEDAAASADGVPMPRSNGVAAIDAPLDPSLSEKKSGRVALIASLILVLSVTSATGYLVSRLLLKNAVAVSIAPVVPEVKKDAPPADEPSQKAAPYQPEPAPDPALQVVQPAGSRAGQAVQPADPGRLDPSAEPPASERPAPDKKPKREKKGRRSGKKSDDVLDVKI